MQWLISVTFLLLLFALVHECDADVTLSLGIEGRSDEENAAAEYLSALSRRYSEQCYRFSVANWNHQTNINEVTEKAKLEESLAYSELQKEVAINVSRFDWRNFQDEDLRRQFRLYSLLGTSVLPQEKIKEYNEITTEMKRIYDTAKICAYNDSSRCNLPLTPDLEGIMSKSRNEKELRHTWVQWREQSGNKMRGLFERYVELSNEAARLNNFSDMGAYWLNAYESPDFKGQMEELWQTLKPFYLELHAYVRTKLADFYGRDIVQDDAPIPAHLLGNMWAQSWRNIYSLAEPFPGKKALDITEEMVKQGLTPLKMFQISDEFYTSLGLEPMPEEFWKNSVFEKIPGREMACHANAWDFCNGRDFRIKQCTVVNMRDFMVVHHEMGHTQYYAQYKHQPIVYRRGANPGFHEAIGDTLVLSVRTPKHLKEIGFLDKSSTFDDYETTINYLFSVAIEKIVFLPFAYIMDKWRWDIFDGTTSPKDYNCHWWKLREEYQGVKPPVPRSEEDFDAGAKYHIPANVEYLRYFVSTVIQFQFHRSLCIAAGQYDPSDSSRPLHDCDIYRSKAAGEKFAAMLSMGLSRPWPEAMRAVTDQDKMDASAIREYFKPLEDWLRKKNQENNATVGWSSGRRDCFAGQKVDSALKSNAASLHLVPGYNGVLVLATSIFLVLFMSFYEN